MGAEVGKGSSLGQRMEKGATGYANASLASAAAWVL